MKKINNNNRFRNNNSSGNSIYSLNYKFDSVSVAGKFTGTALDLIKRYNELAKEAQSRGDYVDMEVFRQYAEHYRKIVTEINARKNQIKENNLANQNTQNEETETKETSAENADEPINNGLVETEAAPHEQTQKNEVKDLEKAPKIRRLKRRFTVVEVTKAQDEQVASANENEKTQETSEPATVAEDEIKPKKRRILKRKTEATNA